MKADVTTETQTVNNEKGQVIKKLHYIKITTPEGEVLISSGESTFARLAKIEPKTASKK